MDNLQILMAERIKKRVKEILDFSKMNTDDCVQIISYAYKWVEADRLKKSFPAVSFYRNWTQHAKLEGRVIDKKVSDFFKELYKQFSIPESIQSTSAYIAEQLSTKKLRNELKLIFKSIQCDFRVLDSLKTWKQFLGCLYSELIKTPLEIKDIINILDKPCEPREYLLPKRLILVNEGSKIMFKVQIYSITIEANGKSSDPTPTKTNVFGKFCLDESRENFLED
ncbi:MAG: hypothetical protein K1060chlam1_01467 [Candidatus Anoxychlamydiales bacterium]|nr:hypothetical protein [Candidatus Anoxychlamydiales bacterium]